MGCTSESKDVEEPVIEEVVVVKRKKQKGKREADLKHIETQIDMHEISDERLSELFPRGYDRLADEVYCDLEYVPAKFIKHEHHIAIYAGKYHEGVVRADRPERLLQNSILTPGLAAAIFNAKYVNAVPINRLAEEFARLSVVKPLVDAYFAWLKSLNTSLMDKSGKLYKAIQYSLNQEEYLRVFLDKAIVPLDNNDAERSIKKFCVGKHSWHIIATPGGAKSSAILYSLAETAKANALKPYEYFKYPLESILDHLDDAPVTYIDDLMPWSDSIPEECRQIIK